MFLATTWSSILTRDFVFLAAHPTLLQDLTSDILHHSEFMQQHFGTAPHCMSFIFKHRVPIAHMMN
jgi:hypothetical protein